MSDDAAGCLGCLVWLAILCAASLFGVFVLAPLMRSVAVQCGLAS